MVTWLTFGVLLVSPGASSATSDGVRPVGSFSISAVRMFAPPPRRVSNDGVAAVTVTASVTAGPQRHVEALDRSEADAHRAGYGLEAVELELKV